MTTKKQIIDFIKNNREYLTNHFHITKIGIFGSFARKEQSKDSDIDLLVEFKQGTENLWDLRLEIEDFFSKAFNRKTDIVRIKYLKPYAREAILNEAVYV